MDEVRHAGGLRGREAVGGVVDVDKGSLRNEGHSICKTSVKNFGMCFAGGWPWTVLLELNWPFGIVDDVEGPTTSLQAKLFRALGPANVLRGQVSSASRTRTL